MNLAAELVAAAAALTKCDDRLDFISARFDLNSDRFDLSSCVLSVVCLFVISLEDDDDDIEWCICICPTPQK